MYEKYIDSIINSICDDVLKADIKKAVESSIRRMEHSDKKEKAYKTICDNIDSFYRSNEKKYKKIIKS